MRLTADLKVAEQRPITIHILAISLQNMGELNKAADLLRAAQQLHPNDLWMNHELAAVLGDLSPPHHDEAVGFVRAALALRSKSPNMINSLGAFLSDSGKLKEATRALHKAIKLKPNHYLAQYNLGVTLQRQGKLKQAIDAYNKAIQINGNYYSAYNNIGVIFRRMGKLKQAIDAHYKVIQLKPNYYYSYINLGFALDESGKPGKAITALQKAIELKPNDPSSHQYLGYILRKKGVYNKAITSLQKAIQLKPDFAEAYVDLGIALRAKKDLDGAIHAFHRAIEVKPKFAEAFDNLGIALRTKGDLDGSITAHNNALKIEPNRVKFHNNLGFAHYAKRDVNGAINAFHKALELDPNYAEGHYNLAIALYGQGKRKEAFAHYTRTIAVNPDHAKAHWNLGVVFFRKGKFQKALKYLLRGADLGAHSGRPVTAQWIRKCKNLIQRDMQIAKVLENGSLPKNPFESLEMARFCLVYKSMPATAVKFLQHAFATQPELAKTKSLRYYAACAAILAASGQGNDAKTLTISKRKELRQQALLWLRANLGLLRNEILRGPPVQFMSVEEAFARWENNPDLVSVREEKALGRLTADEQQSWRNLWSEIEKVKKKLQSYYTLTILKGELNAKKKMREHPWNMTAGKTYVIDMNAKFDSYLRLHEANGKKLAENDDRVKGRILDSRIVFTPKRNGVYRIVATSFRKHSEGPYTLIIREFKGKEE